MPYITASIVVQLGATLYGPWQQLRKEGETGRKKLNQYTRYLTVVITLVQGYLAVKGLESQSVKQGIEAVVAPGLLFEIAGTVSLVGGTLFLMWIGEQITSRGIGNGVSLIIMAGIVASLPLHIAQLFEGGRTGTMDPLVVVSIVALAVVLVLFICFMPAVLVEASAEVERKFPGVIATGFGHLGDGNIHFHVRAGSHAAADWYEAEGAAITRMFVALAGWGGKYFGWSDPDGKVQLALVTAFILGVIGGFKARAS